MDIRQKLFQNRSYMPIPFLIVMVVFADPSISTLIAGLSLVLAGEMFRLWGVSIAGSETRTTGPVGGTFLITTGAFGHVRNPLYVGNILIYSGAGVMANAFSPWLALFTFVFFCWQYSMIVSLEEEHLSQKFGEEYRRYCDSVPRFFINFKRYLPGNNEQPELDWKRGLKSEKRTLQAIVVLTLLLVVLWKAQLFR